MAIRETLASFVARPAARVLAKPLREFVEEALAARRFATSEDIADLRRKVESLRASVSEKSGAGAMGDELAAIKKKLSMAMGALQAATAQMAETRKVSEEALQSARQAQAQASSALATAESAAEGASQVEAQLAATPVPAAETASVEPSCGVPGCTSAHRARGFCGKHYQQWKRGSLENFVSPEGAVTLGDGSQWKVEPSLSGKRVERAGAGLSCEGRTVAALPAT